MKLSIILTSLYLSCIIFVSCGDSGSSPTDFNPPMSGTVYFVDSTRTFTGGYYGIALFRHKTTPFDTLPVRIDPCDISIPSSYYYKMTGIENAEYNIAFIWVTDNSHFRLLGAYGSGTSTNFDSLKFVAYPDYAGMANLNFDSHLDISKALLIH
jgi:hypothetical protein